MHYIIIGIHFDKLEDYRGITISSVLSKNFEMFLLSFLKPYLVTSERQYGFKKGVGCSNAIHTAKSVIDYYTSNGSTVNICTLDLTKAFDNMNHFILLNKLMDLKIPPGYISIIKCWYEKLTIAVKWGSSISKFLTIHAGVRQGGILSPFFFAIFVDGCLKKLTKCKFGCYIKGLCMNSIMYADDLILISISLKHMQSMVDLCASEFEFIGMNINIKKSGCMRIGPRHTNDVTSICLNAQPLKWLQELKYLGIHLLSANRFTFNLQVFKHKYYCALNSRFGKIGVSSSPAVLCSLINSFCVPILMYASEVLKSSSKDLRSMSFVYN